VKNIVSLEGKTIIVTGGAQGIGRALVEFSVELGARVVAVDKNAEGLASLDKSRGDIMTLQGDIAEPAFAAEAVERVTETFGAIHGLVNNAGITRTAMIEKMSFVQWSEVLNVHLTGSFLWTQAVGRSMLARAKAGEKAAGRYRQHLVGRGACRNHRSDQLWRRQKRHAGHDHEYRQGMGEIRNPRQLDLLWCRRNADDRNHSRRKISRRNPRAHSDGILGPAQ
jgi:NAD(P)-dependent dehydrogenase (short-subunit alcohol dehydrogenase family)